MTPTDQTGDNTLITLGPRCLTRPGFVEIERQLICADNEISEITDPRTQSLPATEILSDPIDLPTLWTDTERSTRPWSMDNGRYCRRLLAIKIGIRQAAQISPDAITGQLSLDPVLVLERIDWWLLQRPQCGEVSNL